MLLFSYGRKENGMNKIITLLIILISIAFGENRHQRPIKYPSAFSEFKFKAVYTNEGMNKKDILNAVDRAFINKYNGIEFLYKSKDDNNSTFVLDCKQVIRDVWTHYFYIDYSINVAIKDGRYQIKIIGKELFQSPKKDLSRRFYSGFKWNEEN